MQIGASHLVSRLLLYFGMLEDRPSEARSPLGHLSPHQFGDV